MRIDGSNRPNAAGLGSGKAAAKQNQAAKAQGKDDAVVVSIGTAASKVGSPAARLPEDIAARLESVRAQLEAGTYEIDFARLAHRMADEEAARSGK